MDPDRLLLSLTPDKLQYAQGREYGVELKFDWEDRDLLIAERSLSAHLDTVGIDPGRIVSVHLPPGTATRGDRVGMALTRANVGPIVDFVQDQLDAVPDAYLTAHPPKQFDPRRQLDLLDRITDLTEREISVENTSDESDWYTPEMMAHVAQAAMGGVHGYGGIYLTIDSAHLPGLESPFGRTPLGIDDAAIERLLRRAAEEGYDVAPSGAYSFREKLATDLEDRLGESLGDRTVDAARTAPDREYLPLLKTLCLVGERARSVHLNDPETDTVPDVTGHGDQPVLRAALDRLGRHDGYVVVEGGSLWETPEELFRRVDALIEWYSTG